MKVFDCTTFYSENLMLEIRFNVLNDFVDKFVITEAKYSHCGDKKRLNFNYNRFREFKKKQIYRQYSLTFNIIPQLDDLRYEFCLPKVIFP